MLWQVHTSNLFFVLLSGIPLSGSKICSSVHQLKHAQVHSRFLVVQNKAAINIYIQVSQRNFISLLWSYWVCDKCMFNFIRNWQTVTNVAGPFCLPTRDGWEFPVASGATCCLMRLELASFPFLSPLSPGSIWTFLGHLSKGRSTPNHCLSFYFCRSLAPTEDREQ